MKRTITLCATLLFVACVIAIIISRCTKDNPDAVRPETTETRYPHKGTRTMVLSESRDPGYAKDYVPNTVIITNDVLVPDSRKQVKTSSDEWKQYKKALNDAYYTKGGARTKVTFHVVDADGNSVPSADIGSDIYGPDKKQVRGKTDSDGLFISEGRLIDELVYSASKDGYYKTRSVFRFTKRGVISFENGRNIPWNPTLRVTLKDIRNPIPMYLRKVDLPMPAQSIPVGFDFEAGDWVAPHGKGIHPDMQLTYVWSKGEDTWTRHDFTIAFTNALDGAYLTRQDGFCLLKSTHEADTEEVYRKDFQYLFERTDAKIIHDWPQSDSDLFVFRVRTTADGCGGLRNARYGKIYGPFRYAQGPKKHVQFTYFFNPNDNDPNLEFDGVSNLAGQIWYGGDVPR